MISTMSGQEQQPSWCSSSSCRHRIETAMPGNSSASDTGPLFMLTVTITASTNLAADLHQHDEPRLVLIFRARLWSAGLIRGCRLLGRLRRARGIGERRKLLLRLALRLHHAGRDQQRHRVLYRDIERNDVCAPHVEKKSGGRVRGAGHEGRDVLASWQALGEVSARRLRQEHKRPHAGRWKPDQPQLPDALAGLR